MSVGAGPVGLLASAPLQCSGTAAAAQRLVSAILTDRFGDATATAAELLAALAAFVARPQAPCRFAEDFLPAQATVALQRRRLSWMRPPQPKRSMDEVTVPRALSWQEAEEDFWSRSGHGLFRGVVRPQERAWLRALWAEHGREVEKGGGSGLVPAQAQGAFLRICGRLAGTVGRCAGAKQLLDCATLSATAACGHAPHVDNEQEVIGGNGEVHWLPNNSGHRSWSASVMLSEPWEYEGGEFVFYRAADRKALCTLKEAAGTMLAFRGDRHHCHGVHAVPKGRRLVLLLFFREGPEAAASSFYHRDGTGRAAFLNLRACGLEAAPDAGLGV